MARIESWVSWSSSTTRTLNPRSAVGLTIPAAVVTEMQ
jgi:hypothetical protein